MNQYKFDEQNHVHLLDGKPLCGTSTVCGIIAKPLTYWASGMAVSTLGWVNKTKSTKSEKLTKASDALQMIKGLDVQSYSDLLDKAYVAFNVKKEEAAEAGTDMHTCLEGYVKHCIKDGGAPKLYTVYTHPVVEQFANWATENIKKFLGSEVYVYSQTQWLGGIVDLVYEALNGELYIGDFKSSKEAYFSQFLQTALYHIQLVENGGYDKDGNKLLELNGHIKGYAVFPFGAEMKSPTIRFADEQWMQAAIGAVALYKLNSATN